MKKKIIISCCILLISLKSISQSKKGDVRLTFSGIPLVAETEGSNGLSGFVVKAGVGYFFNDKFSLDVSINNTINSNIDIDGVTSSYNSYSFVPVLRYNFLNQEKIRLFLEGGFGFGTIKYKANKKEQTLLRHEQNSGGIVIMNAGVGANYFFNKNFGLQVILPYLYVRNNTSEYIDTIYNGLAPTIGVTFNLN